MLLLSSDSNAFHTISSINGYCRTVVGSNGVEVSGKDDDDVDDDGADDDDDDGADDDVSDDDVDDVSDDGDDDAMILFINISDIIFILSQSWDGSTRSTVFNLDVIGRQK